MGIALPALDALRRKAVLDAVDSLAARLNSRSAVLALVLRFRLDMLAHPQNFYPIEQGSLPFLDEQTAASWLEVCLHFVHVSCRSDMHSMKPMYHTVSHATCIVQSIKSWDICRQLTLCSLYLTH